MIWINKVFSRRLKILIKRYLVLVDWSKKASSNTKITEIENKIPRVTALVTTVVLNTKAIESENKIPDFTNLTPKQNKLKVKYLTLLIRLPKLLSIPKPQRF